MVFGINLADYFLYETGLYALLALVPFILLYIIKPKPKKIIIPSLMFFIRDKNKSNINSFLQKFFNDFLFYIQFIVIVLLALAIARPYLVVPSISYADSMVFVIDASASMSAIEDGKSRFERAKEIVIERVEGKNTIILATDTTQIIEENSGPKDAEVVMTSLEPRETESSLYDAIVLAESYAQKSDSAVLVISDFSTDRLEKEFFRGKNYLESKGIRVFFEDVSKNKAQNIGIIDLTIKDTEATVWIKNFKDQDDDIKFKYGDKEEWINIPSNDVKSITVPTLNGKSIIEIEANDNFKPDNFAYISTPQESSIKVMLITNQDEKYLKTALNLINKITIEESNPPIVNFNDPNVVIIGNVDKDSIIPGDILKIKKLVEEGGIPLIILAQDNLLNANLGDLFPLELIKAEPVSTDDTVVATHDDSFLTPAEIQFGIARKFYQTIDYANVYTLAHTSKNEYPIITISNYGNGKIMYYGLFDEFSEFKSDIFYPIFWKRSLDFLVGGKKIEELNKKTGHFVALAKEQNIKTPKGIRKGKVVTFDFTGFYDFEDHTMAANLLSEEEQRLNRDKLSMENSKLSIESKKAKEETRNKEIYKILIIIITALLIFELLYLKFRGDV